MYKLFNIKQNKYVQEIKSNFTNKCNINSCGYHFEDITFTTKKEALKDAKKRISYKYLVVIEVK